MIGQLCDVVCNCREDWKPVLTINSIIYGLQYLFLVSILTFNLCYRKDLERVKDEGTAMNYRCEIDTAVVAEEQESADVNGRWEHLKATVIKAAELTLGV